RPAGPWLFAVARNLAVDGFRAGAARPQEVGEAALGVLAVPDEAARAVQSWAVAEAIRSLRPRYRRVLLETFYYGRSVTEVAAVLGIPAGTVRSRTFYALRALKLALEERGFAA
ncbi:MAG TPA: sigma-70 family RNA polymerase sigma factor, partial [Streptosporangiaceae bacterium]|nr:sigma-70 family RNA polymerase sigma factor [Streptosporangiaceae bacterium]